MDWIRYSIIAAVIATCLLIANEWNAFKQQHRATVTESIMEQAEAASVPANNDSVTSDAVMTSDDLPSLEEKPATAADVPITGTSTEDAITVTTDSLVMTISLTGGDIIRVELPRHLETIDGSKSFVLLEDNPIRTYIAQSGLIGPNGTDQAQQRARYEASQSSFTLEKGEDTLAVNLITRQDDGVVITKVYTFTRGEYLVDINHIIDNKSTQPWTATFYAQLKRDSSPDPSTEDSGGMSMQPFLGVATMTNDKPYKKISYDDLAEEPLKTRVANGWIAMVQHYFISAWIPNTDAAFNYSTKVTNNGFNLIRYTGPSVTIAPGEIGEAGGQFYAGPKDQYRLEEIASGLELTVDYGFLWWIAQPLFWLLTWIHGFVGNWGWSIILLTVMVKGAFFHLSATSYRSMAKMRKITPRMQQIRELYADDKQKQSQELMGLYQKEKVNPLGGCLPILIQMPVFISLYWVLMESVELRHAPWLGWITDLSAMDPYFILPLIMGATMFFQQKLNPPPPDPMQAKVMQWMPVFFTFFFLWFPSGLVLYWVVNSLLSILQQWLITRQIEKADS